MAGGVTAVSEEAAEPAGGAKNSGYGREFSDLGIG
jgi:hypothetical protein